MLKRTIYKFQNNQRFKQVVGLFSVNIIGIPIGIITSIIITKYLGPQGYGDFKFIGSIFNVAVIIFSFGFFQAGNRALVLTNNKEKIKEYYGAVLVVTFFLFLVMSAVLILYSIFDNNINSKNLSGILLFLIPFGWVFLLVVYFETLFQADNRIRMLAQIRLLPKLGFLAGAILIWYFLMNVPTNKLVVVWMVFLFTEVVVYLFIIYRLKISIKNFKIRLAEIWQYNKSFGLNVYIGSLFAVGFAQLTEVLISYFGSDNSGVGFYSLALTFSMPLSFIPNTIATTHYKDFSISKKVPGKLLLISLSLTVFALILLWVLIKPFVELVYGHEFFSVISLNYIVSIGVIAHGMSDFFNRFLGANGQGKSLRNSSFVVGGTMLTFSLLLIPEYGEYGAAYARLITGIVYLGIILIYYFAYLKKQKKNLQHE